MDSPAPMDLFAQERIHLNIFPDVPAQVSLNAHGVTKTMVIPASIYGIMDKPKELSRRSPNNHFLFH